MGRGDKIDIESTLSLKIEQAGSQLLITDQFTLIKPAQLIILAEKAFQVTAGKKMVPEPPAFSGPPWPLSTGSSPK